MSRGSTQSLPCHTASGNGFICPNTVVNYTCTITSRMPAGCTVWTTCPSNSFPDMIRLSKYVSGQCSAQGPFGVLSKCGSCRANSIQSSGHSFCQSSILSVNITSAMNCSTVMCSNTDQVNSSIATVVSFATIKVTGMYIQAYHNYAIICYYTPQQSPPPTPLL